MLRCRLPSRLPSSLAPGAKHWNCLTTKPTCSTLCYLLVCLLVNCKVKLTGTSATRSAQGDPRSRDLPAPVLPMDPSEASPRRVARTTHFRVDSPWLWSSPDYNAGVWREGGGGTPTVTKCSKSSGRKVISQWLFKFKEVKDFLFRAIACSGLAP
jgi:hypothetical protein